MLYSIDTQNEIKVEGIGLREQEQGFIESM